MKKLLSLLLALIMVFALLAACGDGSGDSSTATPTPSSGQATATPTPGGSDETEGGEDGYVYRMPIAEGETFSWWRTYTSKYLTSPNEIACNIELEKRTGLTIEYKTVSTTDAAEQFNLMVVSGDYCDFIDTNRTQYVGGYDKAIEDGVFIRINELVDAFAPNYKGILYSNDEIRRQAVTDSGTMGAFCQINDGPQPAWIGPMVRQDWLNDLGLDTPRTYDDWYEMLTLFKNEKGADKTYVPYRLGYSETSHSLTAGFDVAPGFYNENGTIKYGFIEQGFKEYLETMNKWYNDGLIDSEFYTYNDFVASNTLTTTGRAGAFDHMYTMPNILKSLSDDPNYHLKAVPLPVRNEGDVAHFRRVNFDLADAATALTTNLNSEERLEIAARYMDYRYSEEGSILVNFGIEGESYFINSEGKPEFTEMVYTDPEINFSDKRSFYIATPGAGGCLYMWYSELVTLTDEEIEAYDIWGEADGAWVLPPVSLTTEEGQEHSAIYGDIKTHMEESVISFIIGAKPISEFDDFVSRLKELGIDKCIELYQNALDRYYAR